MTASPRGVIIPPKGAAPMKNPRKMNNPRKIIVYIATSADGFIARPDGDVAWLDRPRPKGNYGMSALFQSIDTLLWGYKNYAKGLAIGMKASDFRPKTVN